MLLTVHEFRERVQSGIDDLVAALQEETGRATPEENAAWRSSLAAVARAFSEPRFSPLHLYIKNRGQLSLEYRLPASSAWCDMVLLGRHQERSAAVLVELKDWNTRGDQPGAVEGLVQRFGTQVLHPSDQVRGYTEYCRRFHSAVHDHQAAIYGCVVFTRDWLLDAYRMAPNEILAADYPCFTLSTRDVEHNLPQYFAERLTAPDERFANDFDRGMYRQDRGFVRQIGEQIMDPTQSPFVLLDSQRRALALVQERLNESVFSESGQLRKQVLIIEGPPGSGKSVVAAKLWARLVTDIRLPPGGAVFTTTSASQTSNWFSLFRQAARDAAGSGVVKRATSYSPITPLVLGTLRRTYGKQFLSDATRWRENLATLRALGTAFQDGAQDAHCLVSVVDEAHALINPEAPDARGPFGFSVTLGPQAYHIIRASVLSIFLLDGAQAFRDRENTTVEDIQRWAHELGAEVHETISLADTQFRAAGSKEYVDWVEAVLRGDPPAEARTLARLWRSKMDCRVLDDPAALEQALRAKTGAGKSMRLLASYARQWKTKDPCKAKKGTASPHDLPGSMQDFHEPYAVAGEQRYWSRVWNFIPDAGSDYTGYVQGRPGSRIHDDPLCEVGCPYAVRGFDFDYIGILWLGDLKWRQGRWVADEDHVFESGLSASLRAAKAEAQSDGPEHERLYKALAQGYRILLTRAMAGVYLWFEDEATRAYVQSCLGD